MIITKDGKIKFIYSDKFKSLMNLGLAEIKRASHVEPTSDNQWITDLSPVCPGVRLGPFEFREQALKAEIKWLENFLEEKSE